MQRYGQDQQILLSAVPKLIEMRTGNRPHISTIHRWVHRGIHDVRLQTIFAGGHRRTTPRWVNNFFSEIQVARDGPQSCGSVDRVCKRPKKNARKASCSPRNAHDRLEKEGL